MAVCSLYEIPSFLNLFLNYSGCFSIAPNSQAQGTRFALVNSRVRFLARVVERAALIFRSSDNKMGARFRADLPVHALMRIGLVVPLPAPNALVLWFC